MPRVGPFGPATPLVNPHGRSPSLEIQFCVNERMASTKTLASQTHGQGFYRVAQKINKNLRTGANPPQS